MDVCVYIIYIYIYTHTLQMVYIQHCLRDSQISHCANLNEYEHVAQGYFFTFFSVPLTSAFFYWLTGWSASCTCSVSRSVFVLVMIDHNTILHLRFCFIVLYFSYFFLFFHDLAMPVLIRANVSSLSHVFDSSLFQREKQSFFIRLLLL